MRTWKRRLAVTVLAWLSAIFTVSAIPLFSVSEAGNLPRLVDMADLIPDSEESELSDILDEISERQQVDIIVVTVDSMGGESAMVYADDYYDYNDYGYGNGRDGILLLISMEERERYISTAGYGITAITDAGREYISEIIVEDLSEGDYAAAFTGFARLCDDFITQARTGDPYDVDNLPREPFEIGWNLLTAFGIAFVIALIATEIMKGQLKTVHSQSAAENYLKQGSMQLTDMNDLFLYSHIDRRKRSENNRPDKSGAGASGGSQTHISSSGVTHGGGGGKF